VAQPGELVRRAHLGTRRPTPVLAIGGTTAELDPVLSERLVPVLRAAVAVASDAGAAIVTGGTDAGILHLLSLTVAAARSPVPVIGVAPDGLVADGNPGSAVGLGRAPGGGGARVALDPRLSALVRVPGREWGVETPVLSQVAAELAGSRPAVALVLGGGDVAEREVVEHLSCGRTVVVVAGSGRLADAIAALVEPRRRRTPAPTAAGGGAGAGKVSGTTHGAGTAAGTGAGAGAGPAVGDGARLDGDLRALVAVGDVRVIPLSAGAGAVEVVLRDALVGRPRRTLRQRIPLLAAMPRFRVRTPRPASLVGPDAALRYPALAGRLADVDRVVLPAFHAHDAEAEHEQNRHRWFLLLTIIGGFLTTAFGAVQAWLQSARWPGVVVATLAAGTSALTTVTRRDGALSRFVTARARAERLRSLYFEHLAAPPPADEAAHRAELAALRSRVAQVESEVTVL
jgi:hypothetical protein